MAVMEHAAFPEGLDTTRGSALHFLASKIHSRAFTPLLIYFVAVSLTFVPLLIGALLSPNPLAEQTKDLSLPFFFDIITIFMYTISFPCLVLLAATDNYSLVSALKSVVHDGIIHVKSGEHLTERWNHHFELINYRAQFLGVIAGAATDFFNVTDGIAAKTHGWSAANGHLTIAGYVQLYCDFLFSIVASVYIIRGVFLIGLLRDIVLSSSIRMLPLHPDNAGGLQPIGNLGLRSQYAITLLGVNIAIGYYVSRHLTEGNAWAGFIAAAICAYAIFSPILFVGPLLPFREGMLKNKHALMNVFATRMRTHLDELQSRTPSESITEEDFKTIERLRKIGEVVSDMPIWPFDAVTLKKFTAAYVLPIGSFLIPKLIKYLQLPFS